MSFQLCHPPLPLCVSEALNLSSCFTVIIESVDSICRDGADMPISLNKNNLPNGFYKPFLSALRLLLYTIILSKYIKYAGTVILRNL